MGDVIKNPLDIKFPCIQFGKNVVYVDSNTVSYKNYKYNIHEIHKAEKPLPGIIMRNLREFIVYSVPSCLIYANDKLYRMQERLHIRRYVKQIKFMSAKYIQVEGFSFPIEHYREVPQTKNIAEKQVYAILCEWKNLVFFESVAYKHHGRVYDKYI